MRWMLSLSLSMLAAGASAQVQVPEGTVIRVRLKPAAPPREGKGVFQLPVAEPVIVGGAVVVNRSAEVIARLSGASRRVTAERVRATDGSWIDLRPEPALPAGDAMELEFRTGGAATVEVAQSLRFEAVDHERAAYVRMGIWALDFNRSWAEMVLASGPGMVSALGILLIGVGMIYRVFESRRERA